MIRSLLQKVKNKLATTRFVSDLVKKFGNKTDPKATKVVYFDLSSKKLEIYYTTFFYMFEKEGYEIRVLYRKGPLGSLIFFKEYYLKNLQNLKIVSQVEDKKGFLYIYDGSSLALKNAKKVHISYLLFSKENLKAKGKLKNEIPVLPYPMSLHNYFQGFEDKLVELRKSPKTIKLFFSGNLHPNYYQNPIFGSFFPYYNRLQVLEFLHKGLTNNELVQVLSKEQLESLKKETINKLALLVWKWAESDSQLEARIENHEWIPFLAKVRVFLHCPGVLEPPCHSHTESMSVGCIPLTQFPEMYWPHLQDGINCFYYKNGEELIEKIRTILGMEEEQLEQMSQAVIRYYEEHMSSKAVVHKFLQAEEGKTLFYNSDFSIKELSV